MYVKNKPGLDIFTQGFQKVSFQIQATNMYPNSKNPKIWQFHLLYFPAWSLIFLLRVAGSKVCKVGKITDSINHWQNASCETIRNA